MRSSIHRSLDAARLRLEERGRLEEALSAFGVALEFHPEYPDAHRHKAALLDSLGQPEEAKLHWQTYLQYDQRGPWAEEARQRLLRGGRGGVAEGVG